MKLCDAMYCTGCSSCMVVCPQKAIRMEIAWDGFRRPIVNREKCVDCQLCMKVCPALVAPSTYSPCHVYAAFVLNQEERKVCASGGISTALGRAMIGRHGTVFGVNMQNTGRAVYESARTPEELLRFCNSKYVESEPGHAFEEIKSELLDGREVLFVGLPCHVAGLLNYIPEKLKDKLFTADLICHGVPAMSFLEQHIEQQYGKDAKLISFRNTNAEFFLKIIRKGKVVEVPGSCELYYNAFIEGYAYRESCYHCQFANSHRVSDLTLGDFWGIGDDIPYPHEKRKVSLVLENTIKGQEMLRWIKDVIQIDERTLDEAMKRNEQLCHPSNQSKVQETFRKYCKEMTPCSAARKISNKHVRRQYMKYKLSCVKRKLVLYIKKVR